MLPRSEAPVSRLPLSDDALDAQRTGVRIEIVRDGVRALVDPLNAVVGFSSLLVEGGLDDEERARYAQRVHEAARELEQRLRHLEALTRDASARGEQLVLF